MRMHGTRNPPPIGRLCTRPQRARYR
jgi:hypothetical protein